MIRVVARMLVDEENTEAFLEVAKELIEATRENDGPVSYGLVKSTRDPRQYCILEVWDDMDTLKAHTKKEHFTAGVAKLGPLVTEAPPAEVYVDVI